MSVANGKIEVGDTVMFRSSAELRGAMGKTFTVLALKSSKTNSDNFWVLGGVEEPGLYVIDSPCVLQVLN